MAPPSVPSGSALSWQRSGRRAPRRSAGLRRFDARCSRKRTKNTPAADEIDLVTTGTCVRGGRLWARGSRDRCRRDARRHFAAFVSGNRCRSQSGALAVDDLRPDMGAASHAAHRGCEVARTSEHTMPIRSVLCCDRKTGIHSRCPVRSTGQAGCVMESVGRSATGVLALATLTIFSFGCVASEGFRCGEAPPGSERGRVCDSPEEICVCANRSCATRDFQRGDGGTCDSGYRYLSGPFARYDQRGDCVDVADLQWVVRHGHTPYLCSATIDGGPVDAAVSDGSAADGALGDGSNPPGDASVDASEPDGSTSQGDASFDGGQQ